MASSTSAPDRPTWAIIAGGGTAGHLLPGIAVARELVRRGHDPRSLHFVGAERGSEAELVPEAGFEVTLLPGRGIQRRLTLDNIGAIWGLVRASVRSLVLIRRRRPRVVVALGGFASVACSIAAVLWRVPLVVAEQNARAGAANRLVARFAAANAVPFAETDLPHATLTGNPVRAEVLAVAEDRDRVAARNALGLPQDRTVLAVFAGSLGSRRINQAIEGSIAAWADRSDLAIHHVVGARDWAQRPTDASPRDDHNPDGLFYQAVRYEDRMDLVLAASDLAVCRAGGTTIAELTVVGVPAVLVPLPIATRDHQRFNAADMVRAGAAVLVDDDDLDALRLRSEVDRLTDSASGAARLAEMAASAKSLGRPDADARVADLVEAVAGDEGGSGGR